MNPVNLSKLNDISLGNEPEVIVTKTDVSREQRTSNSAVGIGLKQDDKYIHSKVERKICSQNEITSGDRIIQSINESAYVAEAHMGGSEERVGIVMGADFGRPRWPFRQQKVDILISKSSNPGITNEDISEWGQRLSSRMASCHSPQQHIFNWLNETKPDNVKNKSVTSDDENDSFVLFVRNEHKIDIYRTGNNHVILLFHPETSSCIYIVDGDDYNQYFSRSEKNLVDVIRSQPKDISCWTLDSNRWRDYVVISLPKSLYDKVGNAELQSRLKSSSSLSLRSKISPLLHTVFFHDSKHPISACRIVPLKKYSEKIVLSFDMIASVVVFYCFMLIGKMNMWMRDAFDFVNRKFYGASMSYEYHHRFRLYEYLSKRNFLGSKFPDELQCLKVRAPLCPHVYNVSDKYNSVWSKLGFSQRADKLLGYASSQQENDDKIISQRRKTYLDDESLLNVVALKNKFYDIGCNTLSGDFGGDDIETQGGGRRDSVSGNKATAFFFKDGTPYCDRVLGESYSEYPMSMSSVVEFMPDKNFDNEEDLVPFGFLLEDICQQISSSLSSIKHKNDPEQVRSALRFAINMDWLVEMETKLYEATGSHKMNVFISRDCVLSMVHAVHFRDKLYFANLGQTRAIICRRETLTDDGMDFHLSTSNDVFVSKRMTIDHRVDEPSESEKKQKLADTSRVFSAGQTRGLVMGFKDDALRRSLKPQVTWCSYHRGDIVVLCSHEISKQLLDDEIAELVLTSKSRSEASRKIVDLAAKYGAKDGFALSIWDPSDNFVEGR